MRHVCLVIFSFFVQNLALLLSRVEGILVLLLNMAMDTVVHFWLYLTNHASLSPSLATSLSSLPALSPSVLSDRHLRRRRVRLHLPGRLHLHRRWLRLRS